MQPFDMHPEFYNQPIWLTEEEKQNPLSVIRVFFNDVKLIEARQHLANLSEVAIASDNSIYSDARERDDVLCFCKQLEIFVEAGQTLHYFSL